MSSSSFERSLAREHLFPYRCARGGCPPTPSGWAEDREGADQPGPLRRLRPSCPRRLLRGACSRARTPTLSIVACRARVRMSRCVGAHPLWASSTMWVPGIAVADLVDARLGGHAAGREQLQAARRRGRFPRALLAAPGVGPIRPANRLHARRRRARSQAARGDDQPGPGICSCINGRRAPRLRGRLEK